MERRFLASLNSVPGGHGGRSYGHYCTLSYALFMPFANDSEVEVMEAYNFHAPLLFLRMLSYPLRSWPDDHPAVNLVNDDVAIIDFGCGLAQNSFSLARRLRERGKSVSLFLADVLRLQLEFLEWFGDREGLPTTCTLCTASEPVPSFPAADVLIAEEVLEHVHNPVRYVEELDHLLKPGGLFIANVRKHDAGFMHVSPDLGKARSRLLELGYTELEPEQTFRKPGG
jgi:SAM-dependent methyltransferase